MEHKQNTLRRLLFLALAILLLVPLSLPAEAASGKDAFGIITDSYNRTLLAVAVKNGSEILVFTSSQEPINVGTTGSFSLDGNTAVAVEMISNDLQGIIQRWVVTGSTAIGNTLYETAKPVENQAAAALYPAAGSDNTLVARKTAVNILGIYEDSSAANAAIGYCLKGQPGVYPTDIEVNLGLLLDADGKALSILLGRDASFCGWYGTARASSASGTISEGDSKITSSAFVSFACPTTLANPSLMDVSVLYSTIAKMFAENVQGLDYCPGTMGIVYRADSLRSLTNGKRIADGASYSLNGSFTKGGGACIDDDSYWYMSLTFPLNGLGSDTLNYNVLAMIWGAVLADVGTDPGEDSNTALTKAEEILAKLFEDSADTAVTAGKLVFFRVTTSSGLIVGVDSENFFNNYPTSIQNFKTVK